MLRPFPSLSLTPFEQVPSVVNIAMIVATAAYSGRKADTMMLEGLLTKLKKSTLDLPLMATPVRSARGAAPLPTPQPTSILNVAMVEQAISTNRMSSRLSLTLKGRTAAVTESRPSAPLRMAASPPQSMGVKESVTAPRVGDTSVTAPRIKPQKSPK